MVKVLVQQPDADELGGVGTYVREVLAALDARHERISPVGFSSRGAGFIDKWRAARGADLIHFNSHDLTLMLCARALRRPVNIKYHWPFWLSTKFDYTAMGRWRRLAQEVRYLWRTERRGRPLYFLPRAYSRLVARLVFTCFARSRVACGEFLARSCDGIQPVGVMHNPFPISAESRDAAPRNGLLFVGRLSRDKGVDVILRAMSIASSTFHLTVVGDGPERDALVQMAEDLGLSERVMFCGRQSPDQVSVAMRRAVAVVVPSRWNEPAPYVPLEATRSGAAVVACRIGGLPETAGPGAFFFGRDNYAELAEILDNLSNVPREGENGAALNRKYVSERFDPAACIEELVQYWPELSSALVSLSAA